MSKRFVTLGQTLDRENAAGKNASRGERCRVFYDGSVQRAVYSLGWFYPPQDEDIDVQCS